MEESQNSLEFSFTLRDRIIRELKHWRRRRHGRRLAKNGFKFYSRISLVTKPVQSANLSKNLLKLNM